MGGALPAPERVWGEVRGPVDEDDGADRRGEEPHKVIHGEDRGERAGSVAGQRVVLGAAVGPVREREPAAGLLLREDVHNPRGALRAPHGRGRRVRNVVKPDGTGGGDGVEGDLVLSGEERGEVPVRGARDDVGPAPAVGPRGEPVPGGTAKLRGGRADRGVVPRVADQQIGGEDLRPVDLENQVHRERPELERERARFGGFEGFRGCGQGPAREEREDQDEEREDQDEEREDQDEEHEDQDEERGGGRESPSCAGQRDTLRIEERPRAVMVCGAVRPRAT